MLSTACSCFRKMKYFIHIPETGLGTISSVVTFFESSKNSEGVVINSYFSHMIKNAFIINL